ncbi:MAG: AAA family ATPase [Candidatus Njordarchaeia archaeon]
MSNPWWEGERHYIYEKWAAGDMRWVPDTVGDLNAGRGSLNFIIGPRQIGKTTLIMIYIHDYLLPRINPRSVFYFACDEVIDYRELGRSLMTISPLRGSLVLNHLIFFLMRLLLLRIGGGQLKGVWIVEFLKTMLCMLRGLLVWS